MRKYSENYKILKNQIQESLNFVLLSCHAVPALNAYIKAVELGNGKPPNIPHPDYFQQIADHDRLKEIMPNYKKSLGKFLYLTAFSYFEVYIKSVIEEFFKINGGVENYLSYVKLKRDNQINRQNYRNDLVAQLRDSNSKKKGKVLKYKKAINELIQQGYMFPSQLLSVYGLNELKKELDNIKYMKSKEIPRILNDVFGLEMTEQEKENFQEITDIRNKIAHGEIKEIDLSKAIKMNNFFRELALKIDKHLITNFFIIEDVDIL
ncbi:HEPN domain-containing protein [Anabaena sp. PCC 7108]|uniref:HEPN domain-containing protein n=1 Tax=Anabaena sp. PCC 7108 TaxID=163908 RepID=UPI00034A11DE|nr:HEPN domain-containing protein [Anabaena sp. PCC 7108]